MNVIVTWMYSSPEGEKVFHAQVGNESDSVETQNIYWRCIFLLFESSVRLNKETRHILFINREPPRFIDGIDTRRLVEQYSIELVKFPSITMSPPDFYPGWNTQFIILDVLDWLKENVSEKDSLFILDSDIIMNKPISQSILDNLKRHRALLYSIDYSHNHNINGLTRPELYKVSLEIAKRMGVHFKGTDFVYSGGEFVCCMGNELHNIAELARETYSVCLERHNQGLKKFNEEAHLLSFVYNVLGYETHTANAYIKRMWTDRSLCSNISGAESDLIFWHLPAEKKHGFKKAFRSYKDINGEYVLTATNFSRLYRVEEGCVDKIVRVAKQIVRPIYHGIKNMTNCSA